MHKCKIKGEACRETLTLLPTLYCWGGKSNPQPRVSMVVKNGNRARPMPLVHLIKHFQIYSFQFRNELTNPYFFQSFTELFVRIYPHFPHHLYNPILPPKTVPKFSCYILLSLDRSQEHYPGLRITIKFAILIGSTLPHEAKLHNS